MLGIIIKTPWIEKILSGDKTWEIRGSRTAQRGRIALIKGGSGTIVGTCSIIGCLGPLTSAELQANASKHQVPLEQFQTVLPYKKTYAWVLDDVRAFKKSVAYKHPSGAVIWVRLTKENVPSGIDKLKG